MAGVFMDRRRALLSLAVGGLAAWLRPAASVAATTDDEIDLAKVPSKLRKAADAAVPRAVWTSASKTVEEGEVTYELEGTDAADRYVWVEGTADGKVTEVQTEIPFEEVPMAVKAALKARLPRFKAATVYEARQEGKVVRFDFEGKRPRDVEEIGVYISADGKEVEVDAG